MSLDEEKTPYRPFQTHAVEPHYGRDRGFVVSHTRLDLKLDERAATVEGTATLTLRALVKTDRIELDAEELDVREVRLEGVRVSYETERHKLVLTPARPLKEGAEARVSVRYGAKPRRGLYFIQPDKHYPKKPWQIWSQGESEDNRGWFPGYDYPNNKATSEALLTVRKGFTAISNGRLVGREAAGAGWVRWHWRQDVPQPNYLLALVVGQFDETRSEWDGVPLHYFVPRGKADWGRETFKHTPEILEFFSKATGYRYPYPKYAQAIIADFMWGGMENTSMTTVNERFLIGAQHRDDANPDGLVAHEAAHQWFGNLVTTKSWEHIWLNEAFATYFDALFHEHFYGAEYFEQELLENAEAYFSEDRESYRRPIVTRHFGENEEMFDRHTYQKGSLVLHMLRHELGDDLWWKTIRHYLKKHEWKNVETTDLKVAIEEATGRNLDWFFDQWVYKAGHPELEAAAQFDPKHKFVKLLLKQTQKVAGDTPLFRIPLEVWVWTAPDRHASHKILLSKAEESFILPAAKKPLLVHLDPQGVLLKRLKMEHDASEWAFQLAHAPGAHARIEAARALGKKANDPGAAAALLKALQQDKFWGVRLAAASALGEQETAEALAAALRGVRDPHPRVRRAIAIGLGRFLDQKAAHRALESMVRRDRSDYVVAAALFALAKAKAPNAFRLLKASLGRKSHNDVVAVSCMASLAELKDPRALPLLTQRTSYGRPQYVRSGATHALAKMFDFADKRQQEAVRNTFRRLLQDRSHQQRRSAISALSNVADAALRDRLENALRVEPIGLIRRVARDSLRQSTELAAERSTLGDLKKQLETLQQESQKLKATVAELEKRVAQRRR